MRFHTISIRMLVVYKYGMKMRNNTDIIEKHNIPGSRDFPGYLFPFPEIPGFYFPGYT